MLVSNWRDHQENHWHWKVGGIALSSGYCSHEVQPQPAKHARSKREKQSCPDKEREIDRQANHRWRDRIMIKLDQEESFSHNHNFQQKRSMCVCKIEFAKLIIK